MRISWSSLLRIILTIGLTVLGLLFFKSTHDELRAGFAALRDANSLYVLSGLALTALIVTAQSRTLQLCYESLEHTIPLTTCLKLYLKRFFLSPFIPGGFSVAQYTLNSDLKEYEIPATENTFISTVYVLAGVISYIIVLVPTFSLAASTGLIQGSRFYSVLLILAALVVIAVLLLYVFRKEIIRRLREWLHPYVGHINFRPIFQAFATSLFVDVLGILLVKISLQAVGTHISISTAAIGYILTIIIITISPLFQGLVVVEGALVYTLHSLGVADAPAFAGAIVFRSFQLWIPFVVGGFVYLVPLLLQWLRSGHKIIRNG